LGEGLRNQFGSFSGRVMAKLAPRGITHDPVIEAVVRDDVNGRNRQRPLREIRVLRAYPTVPEGRARLPTRVDPTPDDPQIIASGPPLSLTAVNEMAGPWLFGVETGGAT
jgi:hypothetical protein